MKKFYLNKLTETEVTTLCERETVDLTSVIETVKPIISNVKHNGIQAALHYAKQFDGFNSTTFRIHPDKEVKNIEPLNEKEIAAIDTAADNIRRFHELQLPEPYSIETMPGVICSREFRAIENVGLYIPGGTALLPSTLLMLAIPASIAGCGRIVAAVPVKDRIDPVIVYTAAKCGIDELLLIGGAHGIALMAYGDKEFQKVDKIFGPGNQYVTAAKMLCSLDSSGAAIDMPAGPSELLIIADSSANPEFIAADLLSQAEHGSDSQVVLLTDSEILADKVIDEIGVQSAVPERIDYLDKSLQKSFIVIAPDLNDAFSFSNKYAPEHLTIAVNNAEQYTSKVINAGSVFLGNYSPVSAGDYASGTNHTLPTSGFARSMGGVTVESFMKSITLQKLSIKGLRNISGTVKTLADIEKLPAHKNAVTIRLEGADD